MEFPKAPSSDLLLYINDINNVSTVLDLILFADDTSVFMSPENLHHLPHTLNSIDDEPIDCVKEAFFLGAIVNKNLNWKFQISHIANKVSKSIGIIYKSSFYLSKSSLRVLYYLYYFNLPILSLL